MKRALRLLDIIYASSAVAHEIQNLRHDICCGCKIYTQNCLMMTEEERWDTHGLTAMERISSSPSVWHEILSALGILNTKVHKEFTDHLMGLRKIPIDILLEIYYKYTKTTERWWISYTTYRTLPPNLWSLSALVISAVLVVTNTMSRERRNIPIVRDRPPENLSKVHGKQTSRTFPKTSYFNVITLTYMFNFLINLTSFSSCSL